MTNPTDGLNPAGHEHIESGAHADVVLDLVEEISIDGMCGVY
ncbi:mycofactocin precursor MftA [Nocardioides jensenii]|nr:mycofactocin precursor MftA [Nocardioides jensenii]